MGILLTFNHFEGILFGRSQRRERGAPILKVSSSGEAKEKGSEGCARILLTSFVKIQLQLRQSKDMPASVIKNVVLKSLKFKTIKNIII